MDLSAATKTAKPEQALNSFEFLLRTLGQETFSKDAELSAALLQVFGNSNFLARWSLQHPETIAQVLAADPRLDLSLQGLRKAWQQTNPSQPATEAELFHQLIEFKYRHYFRITLRDLGYHFPLATIVRELSELAQVILEIALAWQQPQGSFCVLGLGKLGGHELNYSSDLDLLYFYGKPTKAAEVPQEQFAQLAAKLSHFLGQKLARGFLYRIDLDLRPEGKAGVLVNSLDALEYYYENFGATWEQQALIKANFAAGDFTLFQKFQHIMLPFIYRKTSDYSFLAPLKKMKEKILASLQKNHHQGFNVKLGEGGIRELEFFVQSLQLLFGGKIPALQSANTLVAVEELKKARLIAPHEAQQLTAAYIFLRSLEHRLQVAEEQQTHTMPLHAAELGEVARRMAYPQATLAEAVEALEAELDRHREIIKNTFARLFSETFSAEN